MKKTKFSWISLLVITLLLFGDVAFSGQPILTDEQLLEEGRKCYDQNNLSQAAMYLFAYIQRNPPLMKSNPEHAKQVDDALSYCLGRGASGASGDTTFTTPIPKPNLPKPKAPQALLERTEGLTGTWKSEHGITYYIRQVGNSVWWYAESADAGKAWAHVLYGTRSGDRLRGTWACIPKGIARDSGTLELQVETSGRFKRVRGGFSETVWTRPVSSSSPRRHIAPPADGNP